MTAGNDAEGPGGVGIACVDTEGDARVFWGKYRLISSSLWNFPINSSRLIVNTLSSSFSAEKGCSLGIFAGFSGLNATPHSNQNLACFRNYLYNMAPGLREYTQGNQRCLVVLIIPFLLEKNPESFRKGRGLAGVDLSPGRKAGIKPVAAGKNSSGGEQRHG